MICALGVIARVFRGALPVKKTALTGACVTVVVHLAALWALASVGAKRLHDTRAGVTVISMSLISTSAKKHNLGIFRNEASATMTEPQKNGAQSDMLAESIARRRESVSLPPFDPYFAPEELHTHPQPVAEIILDDECLQAGTTILKLWISETGHVDRIDIVSGAGGKNCVERAKLALSHASFAPGMRDGAPVKSLWFVEIWHQET